MVDRSWVLPCLPSFPRPPRSHSRRFTITEVSIHVEGLAGALGEDGSVVGAVRLEDGTNLPALWQDGQTTTLPLNGIALARNAAGVTVGLG
jgi:hypothetical protein